MMKAMVQELVYSSSWLTQRQKDYQLVQRRLNPLGMVVCSILEDHGVDTRSWPRVVADFECRGFKKEVKKKNDTAYALGREDLRNWFRKRGADRIDPPAQFFDWFKRAYDLSGDEYRSLIQAWLYAKQLPPGYE